MDHTYWTYFKPDFGAQYVYNVLCELGCHYLLFTFTVLIFTTPNFSKLFVHKVEGVVCVIFQYSEILVFSSYCQQCCFYIYGQCFEWINHTRLLQGQSLQKLSVY